MSLDQNFRELSVNVISHIPIYVKCEIHLWQLTLIFVILSEKLANFWVISREIWELGVNWISQLISEVKHDSVKC